jgi:hypothetical protein
MDMFLGAIFPFYDPLALSNTNFSSYINRTFNQDHLVAKILNALITDLPIPATEQTDF